MVDITAGMLPKTGTKLNNVRIVTESLGTLLKDQPLREGDAGAKGRGVFAMRAMKRGEVCTIYPCHFFKVTDADGTRLMGDGEKPPTCLLDAEFANRLLKYSHFLQRERNGQVWELCGDPSRPFQAGACGHLINDPHPDVTKIKRSKDGCSKTFGHAMLEYILHMTMHANCVMKPHGSGLCVLVVAARDIEEGEELLAPYGYEYWSEAPDPVRMHAEFVRTRTAKQGMAIAALMAPFLALGEGL